MKAKLSVLVMFLLLTSSVFVSAQSIQGTWKLVKNNSSSFPEGYQQLKLITPTHFVWTLNDKDNNIISGAGGKYTLKDGIYTESIDFVLPGMKNLLNKTAVYEVKVEGRKMTINGKIDGRIENYEEWEKID